MQETPLQGMDPAAKLPHTLRDVQLYGVSSCKAGVWVPVGMRLAKGYYSINGTPNLHVLSGRLALCFLGSLGTLLPQSNYSLPSAWVHPAPWGAASLRLLLRFLRVSGLVRWLRG